MNNKSFYIIIAAVFAASIVFWGFMFQKPATQEESPSYDEEITLTMYSSEGCNCCVKWAEYLEEHGIEVIQEKVEDLEAVKDKHAVPGQLRACHTGVAEGYVIEGHVPVEDIRRLLSEKPDAIGISVPGMPQNSPGMDAPIEREYHTILFDAEKNLSVYNTHK